MLSGPDHLAAVAPYAAEGRGRAWLLGARWGVGHASGVLVVGLLALLLREAFPAARLSGWSERFVGVVLIGIGLWGLRRAVLRARDVREVPPGIPREHLHSTPHGRAAFAVGTLHGLAGSSHLLGVLPALALPTRAASALYLAAFGVGSVAAMAAFAATVGLFIGRFAGHGRAYPVLLGACSAAAVGVGAWWLVA